MTLLEHGQIKAGAIVLPAPIPLAEGTKITVRIETMPADHDRPRMDPEEFIALPFIGMWADRQDMADSCQWVRREREQWQKRATRRD